MAVKLAKFCSVLQNIDKNTAKIYHIDMDRIIIYHGSELVIEEPEFNKENQNADYGNAFYCTDDINAAKEWASKKSGNGFANKYLFDARGLTVIDLTKLSVLNWVAILLHNRVIDPSFKSDYKRELEYLEKNYYIDVRQYDVVIGYRADDSFFTFPLMFVESRIRVIKLEDVYNLGFLGKQIALISEKAFKRLKYVESIKSGPIHKERFKNRINDANTRFKEIVNEERWKDGDRLIDLVKRNDKR